MAEILTDEQIKEEKRRKQIAILKASNQLLEESKQKVLKTDKISDLERSQRIKEINESQRENIQKAQTYLQASATEVENAEYNTVSQAEIEKYNRRLEKKGITDEQLRKKDIAEISTVTGNKTKNGRSKRVSLKDRKKAASAEDMTSNSEIIRVANEEELMRQSMVKNDADLRKKIAQREYKKDGNENIEFIKSVADSQKVTETNNRDYSSENTTSTKNRTKKINTDEVEKTTVLKETTKKINRDYSFDFSSIPDYVQYDVIPLPSNGECYPHKKGRIPVAYLTAADENIIASPNMYRDGKIIDVILKRKILDKTINVDELCKGDRDAIALWLRATGYGIDFPIVATSPDTGKKYDVVADLSSFEFLPFNLKGDEEGHFTYKTDNGDILKFKFMTQADEDNLKEIVVKENTNINIINILKSVNVIERNLYGENDITVEENEDILSCINDIRDILKDKEVVFEEDDVRYNKVITEQMILYTVSINGNTDKDYIRCYVENMRAKEAHKYRSYILANRPGVDFSINVDVPKSDGGGSFTTFLRVDNSIFINI